MTWAPKHDHRAEGTHDVAGAAVIGVEPGVEQLIPLVGPEDDAVVGRGDLDDQALLEHGDAEPFEVGGHGFDVGAAGVDGGL